MLALAHRVNRYWNVPEIRPVSFDRQYCIQIAERELRIGGE
jgi:hypothetical protein